MNWRLIFTPDQSGALNMATDRFFLEEIDRDPNQWVVRFYTWSPWCFSLGNAQKAEVELNLTKTKEHHFDIVRRSTGGRVVFHSEELTYSVIGPITKNGWTATLSSTYQRINEILLMGLEGAGYQAQLEKGEVTDLFNKTEANKPCFASTSRSELVFKNRKVVGSAQRRLRKGFLQHGSILTGSAHLRVSEFLKTTDPQWFKDQLEKNSISLDEQKKVELPELINKLKEAFVKEFGRPKGPQEITTLENEKIELIAKDLSL